MLFLEIHEEKYTTLVNIEQVQYITDDGDGMTRVWWVGETTPSTYNVDYQKVKADLASLVTVKTI